MSGRRYESWPFPGAPGTAPPGPEGGFSRQPEGHPRDDLLDARHLRVEPVDEGVVEPDESVPGVDRQPDDEIEVAAAGTVAVAAAPARNEPKRPGLLELESRGRVVGRVIAVAVLGLDRELDSAFAHQLVAAPDPRQRAAAAPV